MEPENNGLRECPECGEWYCSTSPLCVACGNKQYVQGPEWAAYRAATALSPEEEIFEGEATTGAANPPIAIGGDAESRAEFHRRRGGVRSLMYGYHLTEAGASWSVGPTIGKAVGHHDGQEDPPTQPYYVAPRAFVDEWLRRMAHEYGAHPSDESLRAAIEAHRAGKPLPPEEWAQRPAWVPPAKPRVEFAQRRRGALP